MQNPAAIETARHVPAPVSLFDDHGRRIPYPGMRVYNQVSRRYFFLNQPPIDYAAIYDRVRQSLQVELPFTAPQFETACREILSALAADPALANLPKAVHVPFLCPPVAAGHDRQEDLTTLLSAVERAYTSRYPAQDFMNLCPGKPGNTARIADGSRYAEFEHARAAGWVIGVYFAGALAEYDLASQRAQMSTLPKAAGAAQFALAGPADTAAALIAAPELFWNETNYPYHLCLSAIQEPGDPIVYTFEAYGYNLRLRHRSNYLTPSTTQVSEQWAGSILCYRQA